MNKKLLSLLLFPLISCAQIQFAPYYAIPTGSSADVVAIGDVNNDGLKDVVVGTGFYFDDANDYKVFVFLQNSLGYLSTPVKYSYGVSYPGLTSIDIADLNNDGLNDVIVGYGTNAGIFYQNASGTLNTNVPIAVGYSVYGLKAGDLNNDGLNDFVVSCVGGSALRVFTQQANGSFALATYPNPGDSNTEICIADMNDDGRNDMVCMTGGNTANIFFQQASGVFNGFVPNATSDAYGLAVGDLNNDGKPDMAATKGGNTPSSKIVLWMQNPATTLMNAPTEISAYDIPEPIEIADLNNDGKNEIVVVHGGWNNLSCYEQNASGTYGTYSSFPLPYASHYDHQGLAVGDFNNDGGKDVAIADYNQGLVILYNISALGVRNPALPETSVKIYPNPATASITIDFADTGLENAHIEIFNTLGMTVRQLDALDVVQEIDLEDLPSGMYLLKIRSGASEITKKIIKS